jgi:hypothetical protein
MKNYIPPPRIPTPQEQAERRKRIVSAIVWGGALIAVIFALMAYGYSDQAPPALRSIVIFVDQAFGQPVWRILSPAR